MMRCQVECADNLFAAACKCDIVNLGIRDLA